MAKNKKNDLILWRIAKKNRYKGILLLSILAFLVFAAKEMSRRKVSVTLSWAPPVLNTDGSRITDLAGYKIYYREASSDSYKPPIDAGNTTSRLIDGLDVGATYYFSITAYDISGNESAHSVEVSKTM